MATLTTTITNEDVVYDLEELLDDHHTESITFVRDGAGDWYARVNIDGGAYSHAVWCGTDAGMAVLLDVEHASARERSDLG